MNDKPEVTVIIATYNSSRTLYYALRSLLNQTYQDFEAWIIGDACTDDSEKIVMSFSDERLNWFNREFNSGSQGAPNNEGLRRAKGKFIAYLGHDDLWFPWHLSELVSFIQKTNADFIHPLSAMYGPRGLVCTVGPPGSGKTYENHFVFPSSWLHKRNIVEDCGEWGNHLQLSRGVDMDFQRRVYLAGKKILFYPQLSLLKFPSALWRIYDQNSQLPQSHYLSLMISNPADLQHEILLEASTVLARQSNRRISFRQALHELLYSLRLNIMDFYGEENWPLAQLKLWHVQRLRRHSRNDRGLPPYQPK
jgi:glycosyltransferase involved in cell wall biosynthesis